MIRADRIATLYLIRPLKRATTNGRPSVTVLMYHSVRQGTSVGNHPYFETNIDPVIFQDQMSYLYTHGYRVIPLSDVQNWKDREDSKDGKTVILTFDDGFRDFYFNAFPVLRDMGFTATVFLPTNFIGKTIRHDGIIDEYLSWDEIRELSSKGISFGSHTVNHPKLHAMSFSAIEAEIFESKREIEGRLGIPVHSFSYPHAFPQEDRVFTARLRLILEKNEFRYCVTTIIGRVMRDHAQLFLERIPVNSYDDIPLFQAKLEGAYDWLQMFQYIKRMVNAWKLTSVRN